MATSPDGADDDDVFDQFLIDRGHDVESTGWESEYNKKQCPECGGIHETTARDCSVCGWSPQH